MNYVSLSLGILLLTITMIFCAILLTITVVGIVRTAQNEKDRRARQNLQNLREEPQKSRMMHDDLK